MKIIYSRLPLLLTLLSSVLLCSADEFASPQSRYIHLPLVNDGGQTSGSRAVTICLPAGYNATDKRYPVFYIMDGESAFMSSDRGMRKTIAFELAHDQLVHDGLIHPAIFVAIHNPVDEEGNSIRGSRRLDYAPPGQTDEDGVLQVTKSEEYYQFILNSIKPMVDQTFRTKPDAPNTGIAGFSAGGVGAFWMSYLHPETFGMGLCQSPAIRPGFVGKELQGLIDDPDHPVPPVRLWLDAGSLEYDFIYKFAYDTYSKLIAQGFVFNRNIAFYTGHNHGHEYFDCNQRLRSALYFFLRETAPTFTGLELNEMSMEPGAPLELARKGRVILEVVFDEWFRLTDCTAEFTIADPAIATLSDGNELTPITAGITTIASSYQGDEITAPLEVIPPTAQQTIMAATDRPVIDGDLSDWPELSIHVTQPFNSKDASSLWKGVADLSYRFDCSYDDDYLYIAVQTTDDLVDSVSEKDPWVQDGVEIRLDARPEQDRLFAKGAGEFKDILLVAMSPALEGETREAFNFEGLPEGTQAICVATESGHNTEIAIPISYLNDKAGDAWSSLRLNVVVNDFDNDYSSFPGDKFWWQPDWRRAENTWASGTFIKK